MTYDEEYKIIDKAVDYIIKTSKEKNELIFEHDTIYYIAIIMSNIGAGDAVGLFNCLSEETKTAFEAIGANNFGNIFEEARKNIYEQLETIKGPLKKFRAKKIIKEEFRQICKKLYDIESVTPLTSSYLIPYILKNLSDEIDFKNLD